MMERGNDGGRDSEERGLRELGRLRGEERKEENIMERGKEGCREEEEGFEGAW